MATRGKNNLTLRKKDLANERTTSVGYTKFKAWHKATAGETGINILSLNFPSEITAFTNPSASKLAKAQLRKFSKNLTIISSLRGELMNGLSYTPSSASQINFTGFTADEGEIFEITLDHEVSNSVNFVDGRNIVATGDLPIGETDFNVGQAFEVNKYQNTQIGAVLVYREGVLQRRNPNNTTSGGDYQEVDAGGGTGVIIRFNVAPVGSAEKIDVVSNGVVAERPTVSQQQDLEKLQAQIDIMIPDLATLAAEPESKYQVGPNQIDLKAFGDLVFQLSREVSQIGDVVHSMLTEAQFNAQRYGTWVLMDGRSVAGTQYETITGNSNVPDARGRALAGKDDMGGVNANRLNGSGISSTTLGASGGSATHTLTDAEMPSHDHGGGSHVHTDTATSVVTNGGILGTLPVWNISGGVTGSRSVSSSGTIISSNGSDAAHQNTQPTLITNIFIRVD